MRVFLFSFLCLILIIQCVAKAPTPINPKNPKDPERLPKGVTKKVLVIGESYSSKLI